MKKILSALKNLVENRKEIIHSLQDTSQPWNIGNEAISINLAKGLSEFLSKEIEYLEAIIQNIEREKSIKCKHPKKDRDKCNGVWYCMNCNSDL